MFSGGRKSALGTNGLSNQPQKFDLVGETYLGPYETSIFLAKIVFKKAKITKVHHRFLRYLFAYYQEYYRKFFLSRKPPWLLTL